MRALLASVIGWPISRTAPLSGLMISMIVRIVVVLPAPLGPRRPKISPSPTEKLTPSTALTLA